MIKYFLTILVVLPCFQLLYADENSEFYVEEGLVSRIFEETASTAHSKNKETSSLVPMLGMIKPSSLKLANKYFATNYSQLGSLPYFYLMGEKRLASIYGAKLLGSFSMGYGYLQQNIETKDSSGLEIKDTVSLQWMPIELGAKYQWPSISSYLIKPSIDIGAGRLWIHQDGNIDGFDQGFFVSYFTVGSTIEVKLTESITVLGHASYLSELKLSNANYKGWKLGVGAWLSI